MLWFCSTVAIFFQDCTMHQQYCNFIFILYLIFALSLQYCSNIAPRFNNAPAILLFYFNFFGFPLWFCSSVAMFPQDCTVDQQYCYFILILYLIFALILQYCNNVFPWLYNAPAILLLYFNIISDFRSDFAVL